MPVSTFRSTASPSNSAQTTKSLVMSVRVATAVLVSTESTRISSSRPVWAVGADSVSRCCQHTVERFNRLTRSRRVEATLRVPARPSLSIGKLHRDARRTGIRLWRGWRGRVPEAAQPQLRLVLRRLGPADCHTVKIGTRPALRRRRRSGNPRFRLELAPRALPHLKSTLELRLGPKIPQLRVKRLQVVAPLRDNHANRLAGREGDRDVGARELPVHRELRLAPVSLYQPFKRMDAILRRVRWSTNEQVEPRRGAKDVRDVPRQNAVPKMTHRRIRWLATTPDDLQTRRVVTPRPYDEHAVRIQDEPARLVRHQEWQAAIGVPIDDVRHPRPRRTRRHQRQQGPGDTVGHQCRLALRFSQRFADRLGSRRSHVSGTAAKSGAARSWSGTPWKASATSVTAASSCRRPARDRSRTTA